MTDRGETEMEERQDRGRQTYSAAERRKREKKLADDSLSWSELLLRCSLSPSTSPSTPIHLTCLQSNLNVCFTASLSKIYKWCALKAVGKMVRGEKSVWGVISVLGERWGGRLVR